VPLERFTGALHLLAGRSDVDAARVAAIAVSRGSEGLLAAVTTDPSAPCRGLVLVSPSSVSWQAIGGDGNIPDTPSWMWAGKPVAWRPVRSGELMGSSSGSGRSPPTPRGGQASSSAVIGRRKRSRSARRRRT
jgi:hypothetical protein